MTVVDVRTTNGVTTITGSDKDGRPEREIIRELQDGSIKRIKIDADGDVSIFVLTVDGDTATEVKKIRVKLDDGTVEEQEVERVEKTEEADGEIIEKRTFTEDGLTKVEEKRTRTNPDGSFTTTITDADGNEELIEVTNEEDGSQKTKRTFPNGEVEETSVVTDDDGKTQVIKKKADGSEIRTKTEVVGDETVVTTEENGRESRVRSKDKGDGTMQVITESDDGQKTKKLVRKNDNGSESSISVLEGGDISFTRSKIDDSGNSIQITKTDDGREVKRTTTPDGDVTEEERDDGYKRKNGSALCAFIKDGEEPEALNMKLDTFRDIFYDDRGKDATQKNKDTFIKGIDSWKAVAGDEYNSATKLTVVKAQLKSDYDNKDDGGFVELSYRHLMQSAEGDDFDSGFAKEDSTAGFCYDPSQEEGTDKMGAVGEVQLLNGAMDNMFKASAALIVSILAFTSF